MNPRKILCASHGTSGARAAEAAALTLCHDGVAVHHLLVIPDFWKGMMGDDWLNNAASRDRYGQYVENQLHGEAVAVIERFGRAIEDRGGHFSFEVHLGKPAECLLDTVGQDAYDIAIMGSPRPKGVDGYRSHMNLGALVGRLRIPLMIVPHPGS